jgi:hypothetical protein
MSIDADAGTLDNTEASIPFIDAPAVGGQRNPPATDAGTDDSPPVQPTHLTDEEGLADWGSMPRLEPVVMDENLSTSMTDTTLLQIKSALTSKRHQQRPQATKQPSGNPRRSARERQPSHDSLISIANMPAKAPKPPPNSDTPTILEGSEGGSDVAPAVDDDGKDTNELFLLNNMY